MSTLSADREPTCRPPAALARDQPSNRTYAILLAALILFGAFLAWLIASRGGGEAAPSALLGPLFALAALIGVVWTNMLIFRNYAAVRGLAPARYYLRYDGELPPDWVERPARAFNNLMQVPLFFCVACLLMMVTERLDAAQVALAWVFVAARLVHAVIYIVWNHLPSRFGAYVAGVVVLAVLFARFARQSWDLVI
jgi:hypothetical protein